MSVEPTRRVSNSELQSFKGCRRRWYLGNYRRLGKRAEDQVGPLKMGTRVHEALAVLYDGGDPLVAYAELSARDREVVVTQADHHPDPESLLKRFDSEEELARIMVEGYIEWLAEEGADADYSVIAAEEAIAVALGLTTWDGRPVELVGKLDLRVRNEKTGDRLFVDHKTAQSFLSVFITLSLTEQFLTYQLLELLKYGGDDLSTGALVSVLRKVKRGPRSKPPFYLRREVHHSRLEVENFRRRVLGEVHDLLVVEQALDYGADHRVVAYPRPSRDCTWSCEFIHACQMFEDGSDVDRYLDDHFAERDPLERYAETPEREELDP
jgi:hypothetical protein